LGGGTRLVSSYQIRFSQALASVASVEAIALVEAVGLVEKEVFY
jgi:hypothetical protein